MKAKLVDPSWFNLFIPVSVVLHFTVPVKILIQSPFTLLGIVFMLAGSMLNVVASNHLRKNRTPVDFDQAPTRLVMDGPFRLSRNPIYLGGVTLLLGVAVLLGSLVSFLFPVLLFFLLNLIYIPSEEEEMEEAFGADYVEYKRSVRRWV